MFNATADIVAFAWFLLCWIGYSLYSVRAQQDGSCVMFALHKYHEHWMQRMMKREHRIADVNIIATLIRSVSLFASTSIFILAGLVTVLGGLDVARELVSNISFAANVPREVWEIKLMLLILIFIHAFFTFVWSMRQFNFSLVMIGAAPMPKETDSTDREGYAKRAALLISRGAGTFNRGLRAYYFGLAMLAWFIQPWLLMVASVCVVIVLYRREFRSITLSALIS